jgi:hypothetical protein
MFGGQAAEKDLLIHTGIAIDLRDLETTGSEVKYYRFWAIQ